MGPKHNRSANHCLWQNIQSFDVSFSLISESDAESYIIEVMLILKDGHVGPRVSHSCRVSLICVYCVDRSLSDPLYHWELRLGIDRLIPIHNPALVWQDEIYIMKYLQIGQNSPILVMAPTNSVSGSKPETHRECLRRQRI